MRMAPNGNGGLGKYQIFPPNRADGGRLPSMSARKMDCVYAHARPEDEHLMEVIRYSTAGQVDEEALLRCR